MTGVFLDAGDACRAAGERDTLARHFPDLRTRTVIVKIAPLFRF
jgi:hypothetical protein